MAEITDAGVILVPDNVNDIIPPGYLDNGSLPLDTVNVDLGIVPGGGVAITGECVDQTDPCTEYWCLDDGAPPGYQPIPDYTNTIPGIEFCTSRPNLSGENNYSDGKYVVYWSSWTCSLFLEDGTERQYSRVPPNDPQNGAGYWLVNTCVIYNDKLIMIVAQQNADNNLYYVEYDIVNNVSLREGFFRGTSVNDANKIAGSAMHFSNVRGGILTVGGLYTIHASGVNTKYLHPGLFLVNLSDFSWNMYGRNISPTNRVPDGMVWEENTFNFLYCEPDPYTDGKNDLYYSTGEAGDTKTEIIFPNHPTTEMLGVYDLLNGKAAVVFTDRVIICTSNGTFIKEITEGYSMINVYTDYNTMRIVSTYQDKFIIASNLVQYKNSSNVGVADVYNVDTLDYMYTLNIPAASVASNSYYDTVQSTDYATYRRRSNDNNNQDRDLLICVKTQEA